LNDTVHHWIFASGDGCGATSCLSITTAATVDDFFPFIQYPTSPQLVGTSKIASFVGKWTHVLISWNPNPVTNSNSDINIYINGSLNIKYSNQPSFYNFSNQSVYIGNVKDSCIDVPCFNGRIDEMRIYSQSIQTAQVQQLYAEGLPTRSLVKSK
jgi:hypothetical protein